ncbi:ASCH domain-containing protein [Ornithinimicrobium sp. Y1847]|uniref:ASCH domain-containing protein n=1 Tax=unclassified Ornithinimicrobium TaxID=2615080 RepID=UPI003B672B53
MSDPDDQFEDFWRDARVRARLNPADGYLGVTDDEVLRPPAWAFGATPEEADRLLGLVTAGAKTATASVLWEYEAQAEELPRAGDLSIVLDGSGEPTALIRTTHVEVRRFADVDEEHARREGEGSLAQWRREHQRFFAEHAPQGQQVTDDTQVVLERFVCLVPVEARREARRAGLL